MFRICCLAFVFALAIKSAKSEDDVEPVLLGVYYESKCSDSKNFILDQLHPTLEFLHKYIRLEPIPFGKAASINRTSFECQHGPPECLGNLIQGCAINLMKGKKSDIDIVKYLVCELKTEASTRNDLRCVRKANINTRAVIRCMENGEGIDLQHKYERMTKHLRPEYIPTITFNSVFDQSLHDSAIADLTETVCSYLDNMDLCWDHYMRQKKNAE